MAEIKLYLPSSLDEPPVCTPGPDGHCSVCADEGTPGRVLELRPGNMALVELPDGFHEVAVDLIEDIRVGDFVLVHLGFAIARLALTPGPSPKAELHASGEGRHAQIQVIPPLLTTAVPSSGEGAGGEA